MSPTHRYDAHAEIVPGEHELPDRRRVQLLRLMLTDDGPLTDARPARVHEPDVFCHLTARQARELADRLHAARRPAHDQHDHRTMRVSADTHYQQLREHLAALRLTTIADRLAPALEQAERDKPGYTLFLADLLAAEVHAVEQRRLQGRLRFARLPARKTLEQFDFTAQPSLDRAPRRATSRRCDFLDERANVLLIGPARSWFTVLPFDHG